MLSLRLSLSCYFIRLSNAFVFPDPDPLLLTFSADDLKNMAIFYYNLHCFHL